MELIIIIIFIIVISKLSRNNETIANNLNNNHSNQNQYLNAINNIGLPTSDSNYLWVKYPQRILLEIEKMLKTNASLRRDESNLVWDERIYNNFGTFFDIEIKVEPGWPHRMPKVFIKNAGINYKKGKHLNSGGDLCLIDNSQYHSNISVLEFRNQACSYCFCVEVYTHTGEWPAAQH